MSIQTHIHIYKHALVGKIQDGHQVMWPMILQIQF